MRIIIEGCDGTGKTSVAKILAEKYGCDLVHMTGDDPKDRDFYFQSIRKENVVYDRNVIGEMVYPYVFNRNPQLQHSDCIDILKGAHTLHVYVFVLTAKPETCKQRLMRRGNECKEVLDKLDYINAKFKTLAYECDHIGVIEIDTTMLTIDQTAAKIIKIIESRGE